MGWLRSRMKIQELLYISRQSINPCQPNISIHICFWIRVTANIKGHVTILQQSCSPFAVHVLFSGKAVSGTWAPSTLFLLLCESAHVWPIKMYLRWSLFFITRSPLSGASIFHSYPLSQPCLFFFLFHGVVRTSAWFRGKLKSPPRILVLKIKRYGTGLTQGYNQYGCSG